MDIITTTTMERLVDHQADPSVSIFMPTHRFGRETAQDPIRLGNQLDAAHAELVALGFRPPEADGFLGEARGLIDRFSYWQHQEDGLALFITEKETEAYRLPSSFESLVVVADRFHVKPLWPLLAGHDLFHVLALSRNEVRLLWADRYRVGDVDLPDDIPTSLAEALWFEDPEKQLQHHGADRVARGRVVATFHGHGAPDENEDARLDRFLRAVDGGLASIVDPDSPIVLAGVDEITAQFRRLSRHRAIAADSVSGNPDMAAPQSLHARAVEIMAPRRRRALDDAAAAFHAAGTNTVTGIADAVPAALGGRMATVFVPIAGQVWGRADPLGTDVEIHVERAPGDRDLIDLVGAATWARGGDVYAVVPDDVPGDGPLAGVLRY